ncbi:MAG TPA: type VI secretion system baseplate subunit TssF [Longimicrobium sp.]|uniref:type VI secretion system baseplate subunit TssF n=1 Tax=Longimicrobium sp. TaxID=2029185 RepID=UPI002ED89A1E
MSAPAPDNLLDYYLAELAWLRRAGGEFAQAHPKVAARLQLGAHESQDPHVERLIESFAFSTARLQHALEVETPGISSALLDVLQPNYLAPVPPVAIAEFVADPTQGRSTAGFTVPAGTPLVAQPREGDACRFRTAYPVTLHPLAVTEARMEPPGAHSFLRATPRAASVLRVRLEARGVPLSRQKPASLRFHLGGEMSTAAALYELLFGHLLGIAVLPGGAASDRPARMAPSALVPVGLGADEGVLPSAAGAHPAYRLLQEYFTIPRKLMFADLHGVDFGAAEASVDLLFVFDRRPPERLEAGAENFRLGCTPVVNLHERLSEPVRVDGRRVEYRLVGDARRERSTEIHSILSVSSAPEEGREAVIEPFYSFSHRMDPGQRAFWHARRVPSERADLAGTDTLLSFLNLNGQPASPPAHTVWGRVLCTNRRLAEQIPAGALLQAEQAIPVSAIRVLHPPTRAVDPPLGGQTQWRLISHLSLNHLSLAGADADASLEALREILRLYAAWGDPSVEAQVAGLRRMTTRPAARRVGGGPWRGFCRGTEIDLTVDESAYAGGSALLLASVLDRFFALYAAVNSFTRLSVRRQNQEGVWKSWDARIGDRPLL